MTPVVNTVLPLVPPVLPPSDGSGGSDDGLLAPLAPIVRTVAPVVETVTPVVNTVLPLVPPVLPPSDGSGGSDGGLLTPLTNLLPPSTVDGLGSLNLPAPPSLRPPAAPLQQLAPSSSAPAVATPPVPPAPPAPPVASSGVLDAFSGSAHGGDLSVGPTTPAGLAPLAGLIAAQQSALAAAAQQSAQRGATPAHGGGNPPQAPEPGTAGGSPFAAGSSGAGFGLLLALLFSLAAFALQHYGRLRLPPGQWRSFAFIAVVERPG